MADALSAGADQPDPQLGDAADSSDGGWGQAGPDGISGDADGGGEAAADIIRERLGEITKRLGWTRKEAEKKTKEIEKRLKPIKPFIKEVKGFAQIFKTLLKKIW